MNIPEHILQQVADKAFLSSNGGMMGLLTCNKEKNHVFWNEERYERRAVIQHALDNPALAPWLNVPQAWPPVGEYTDQEISEAWDRYEGSQTYLEGLRAFLAALPRRESPDLAQAIARAEKADAELATMTALADRLAEVLRKVNSCRIFYEESLDIDNYITDEVRNALAAYENHKKPDQQVKHPCDCIEKCGKFWVQRCDCQNSTNLAEAQSWCDHENHKKQAP